MAMRIEISRLMAGVIVVLAWHLLLPFLFAMAVGVEITWLVTGMIVMFAWLFLVLGHCLLLRAPRVARTLKPMSLQKICSARRALSDDRDEAGNEPPRKTLRKHKETTLQLRYVWHIR